MEPDDRTYYARLEALERGMERVQAILAEHSRRIDGVEQIAARLGHIEALLARLEERLGGLNNSLKIWVSLLTMLLGGLLAVAWRALEGG